jgi:sigma-54-specific transcriptional regulator
VPQQPAAAANEQANLLTRLERLFGELIDSGESTLFDSVEEILVRTAFAGCHQNQVQTARVLGISRNILRTHLKRFGLIRLETTSPASGIVNLDAPSVSH